jgi:hypothetical protein
MSSRVVNEKEKRDGGMGRGGGRQDRGCKKKGKTNGI